LRTLLRQLSDVVTTYIPSQGRATTRAHAAHALWQLANDADEESDVQFQSVTAFAQLATSSGQLDLVQGLLDGTKVLAGLTIDTDLGWMLLTALAAGGRVTDTQIAARLAQDRTAAGEQAAARVRAALARPQDKARAWDTVFERGDVSNHTVQAIGAGFLQVHDTVPLEPCIERFLGALMPVWESRTYAIVEQIVEGFYPWPLANDELAEATRVWLDAHPHAPDALRRVVSEHLSDVERALAAQACERRRAHPKETAHA